MDTSIKEEVVIPPHIYFRSPRHYGTWIFIIFFIFVLIFVVWIAIGTARYSMFIEVAVNGNERGANMSVDVLDFGSLSTGVSATRVMKIENKTFLPMRIIIIRTGDIGELVRLSKNYFKLPPKGETTVELNAYVLPSMIPGTFSQGTISIFKIPFI